MIDIKLADGALCFPEILDKMTEKRATRIKDLFANNNYSLRVISSIIHDEWGVDACWPDGNQLAACDFKKIIGI